MILTSLRHRLPVYPAYLEDPGRWLDGQGGASSILAAVLRSSDSEGLVRGSIWAPGSTLGEREGLSDAFTAQMLHSSATPELPPVTSTSRAVEGGKDLADLAAQQPVTGLQSPTCASSSEESSGNSDAGGPHSTADTPDHLGQRDVLATLARSSPAPRPLRSGRAWKVAVTLEGLLAGCPTPPARPEVQRLLDSVLEDSYELTEQEMLMLFNARGADFQVIPSSASQRSGLKFVGYKGKVPGRI